MSEKTYRIGEAAAKLKLKTYVLRFWEMEFPAITPIRTEKGQRLYREKDIALLGRIQYLLHERGLTIEGARRVLSEEAARGVEYHDAEIARPEDADVSFSDSRDTDDAGDGDDAVVTERMEQASLLPFTPSGSGKKMPDEEIHRLVADLEDIHRLLVAGVAGGAS